jgi:uncharacterized protein YbjT (DUF2867 family)
MKKVLVTGGTGTLGKAVVHRLLNLNYEVNVLSSRQNSLLPPRAKIINGNLATNTGLYEATHKQDTVIHCATNAKEPQIIDVKGTANLLEAMKDNQTPHIIYISIVGVDKSTYPYYQAKAKVENMITESGISFSILRATQFHDLVLQIIQSFDNKTEAIQVPAGMQFQSIDVQEVAYHLVELVEKKTEGLLPEIGGPEVLNIEAMVNTYLKVLGRKNSTETKAIKNELYDLFRSGINLCPANIYGRITWEKFLHRQFNI